MIDGASPPPSAPSSSPSPVSKWQRAEFDVPQSTEKGRTRVAPSVGRGPSHSEASVAPHPNLPRYALGNAPSGATSSLSLPVAAMAKAGDGSNASASKRGAGGGSGSALAPHTHPSAVVADTRRAPGSPSAGPSGSRRDESSAVSESGWKSRPLGACDAADPVVGSPLSAIPRGSTSAGRQKKSSTNSPSQEISLENPQSVPLEELALRGTDDATLAAKGSQRRERSEFELPRPHFSAGDRLREGYTATGTGRAQQRTASAVQHGDSAVGAGRGHTPPVPAPKEGVSTLTFSLATAAANANRHKTIHVEEAAFVTDILFMWMGVESTQYFYFDAQSGRYFMVEGYGTHRQRHFAEAVAGSGSLARLIDLSLKSQNIEPSFLQQSLRSAIRRQLTQYHYLVCSLRERSASTPTLGDLVVAHSRVHPKLSILHHILKETERAKGGELVSKMQELIQQGSQRLIALASAIYMETVSPLLQMTVQCLTKGDVQDPFSEFFVTTDPKVDDTADNYWTSKFSLAPEMLPTTVPRALAERIVLVAKNIAFIRHCCRSKAWRVDPHIVEAANRASFETLAAVAKDVLDFSNSAVMTLLTEKFRLYDVMRMIDSFLLVGNGDFYEILIRKLDPFLSKMSNMVQTSVVRDNMQSALQEVAPYIRNVSPDLLQLVHCEIVKDDRIIGWDAFVVSMPMPSPLNNIFDTTAMKIYRRLFRIMFKVKRAEVTLKNSWRQNIVLDRIQVRRRNDQHEATAWREVAADAHLLGLQLNHFVNNLWSYLVSEVSMVAWDMLMKALRRCESLDDIRMAHSAYLQHLTLHSLLHSDCATIRQNIESILSMVRQYSGAQVLLTALLERGHGDVFAVKREYQRITDDYHREISALLTTLEQQHMQFDFLNFLLLRLNFNQFYHDTDMATNTDF